MRFFYRNRLALGSIPQSPAGTVNAGFFGNLKAYYDASRITGLNDADSVATWSDLSGNGLDLSQPTASNKPTYKTAIQNGLPVVRFDGSSDWMYTGSMFTAASDLSIFCVCKQAIAAAYRALLTIKKDATSQNGFIHLLSNTALTSDYRAYQKFDGESTGVSQYPLTAFDATRFKCIELLVGANMIFRINGEQQDSDAITQCDFATYGPGILHVGTYYTDIPSSFFLSGDIGELVIYDEALPTDRADLVSNYLKTKWGIV